MVRQATLRDITPVRRVPIPPPPRYPPPDPTAGQTRAAQDPTPESLVIDSSTQRDLQESQDLYPIVSAENTDSETKGLRRDADNMDDTPTLVAVTLPSLQTSRQIGEAPPDWEGLVEEALPNLHRGSDVGDDEHLCQNEVDYYTEVAPTPPPIEEDDDVGVPVLKSSRLPQRLHPSRPGAGLAKGDQTRHRSPMPLESLETANRNQRLELDLAPSPPPPHPCEPSSHPKTPTHSPPPEFLLHLETPPSPAPPALAVDVSPPPPPPAHAAYPPLPRSRGHQTWDTRHSHPTTGPDHVNSYHCQPQQVRPEGDYPSPAPPKL